MQHHKRWRSLSVCMKAERKKMAAGSHTVARVFPDCCLSGGMQVSHTLKYRTRNENKMSRRSRNIPE